MLLFPSSGVVSAMAVVYAVEEETSAAVVACVPIVVVDVVGVTGRRVFTLLFSLSKLSSAEEIVGGLYVVFML